MAATQQAGEQKLPPCATAPRTIMPLPLALSAINR